jgi:succinate-semialdehyde dehydrogenase/glutarate-semialdehyde dehydrogenase
MSTVPLLIGGEWTGASDGATLPLVNPANEDVIGSVASATEADVERALAAVEAGWHRWRRVEADRRADVLEGAAAALSGRVEDLARTLTREQGKPLRESRAEVAAAIAQFSWFAAEARRHGGRVMPTRAGQRNLVVYEPIGPVAAFTPWNFPVLLAARKVAPALAAGCSVLLKPAEEAPSVVSAFVEALVGAGLPAGALNVITGDPAGISRLVLASEVIRKVSFTGSVPVGRYIGSRAGERVMDMSLELGGHAPVIVFDDVDPVLAARRCVAGKFRNAGQVCIAPTRFYVHASIADVFTDAFVAATRELVIGDGLEPGTDLGPLANRRRLHQVEGTVAEARAQGAAVRCGGVPPEGLSRGYFFSPTVLTDVPRSASILRDEPFGPVAPILSFDGIEEGLALANDSAYGLAGYVLSEHAPTIFRAVDELQVGIVGVNTFAVSSEAMPFGGTKLSGVGRESGIEAMRGYSYPKAVTMSVAL